MSQILTGKVISIDLDATAKGQKGEYPAWELIYKNGYGEVKTITKHINGYKYNKPLANGLDQLAAGEEFTMEQEKNEGGYWEPKVCYAGIKEEAKVASTPSQGKSSTGSGGGNSTYPTSDERKVTQTQIVRQSSLGHAVNFISTLTIKKKEEVAGTPADIIKIAKEFEAFVHGNTFDIVQDDTDDTEIS